MSEPVFAYLPLTFTRNHADSARYYHGRHPQRGPQSAERALLALRAGRSVEWSSCEPGDFVTSRGVEEESMKGLGLEEDTDVLGLEDVDPTEVMGLGEGEEEDSPEMFGLEDDEEYSGFGDEEDEEEDEGEDEGTERKPGLRLAAALKVRRRARLLTIAAIRARRRARLATRLSLRARMRARLIQRLAIRARRRARLVKKAAIASRLQQR